MSEIYNVNLRPKGCFGIEQDHVSRLMKACSEFTGQHADVQLRFRSDSKVDAKDASFLDRDPLVRSEIVEEIRIDSSNFETKPRRSTSIKISTKSNFLPHVEISISGSFDDVNAFKARILSEMSGAQLWYSKLRPDLKNKYGAMILGISGGAVANIWLTKWLPTGWENFALTIVGTVIFGFSVMNLINFLFPMMVIMIGMSANVYKTKSIIRNFLFTAVVVAFVINIASGYVQLKIFNQP